MIISCKKLIFSVSLSIIILFVSYYTDLYLLTPGAQVKTNFSRRYIEFVHLNKCLTSSVKHEELNGFSSFFNYSWLLLLVLFLKACQYFPLILCSSYLCSYHDYDNIQISSLFMSFFKMFTINVLFLIRDSKNVSLFSLVI